MASSFLRGQVEKRKAAQTSTGLVQNSMLRQSAEISKAKNTLLTDSKATWGAVQPGVTLATKQGTAAEPKPAGYYTDEYTKQYEDQISVLTARRDALRSNTLGGVSKQNTARIREMTEQISDLQAQRDQQRADLATYKRGQQADSMAEEAATLQSGSQDWSTHDWGLVLSDSEKLIRALVDPDAADKADVTVGAGKIQNYYSDVRLLTEPERATLMAYANAGQYDKAKDYYDLIKDQLNQRTYTEESEAIADLPGAAGTAARAVLPVAANLAAPVAYGEALMAGAKSAITGDYTPVDVNAGATALVRLGSEAQTQTVQDLSNAVYDLTGSSLAYDVTGFLTPLGYSIINNAINLAWGPELALANMSLQAAGQETVNQLSQGTSLNTALKTGTLSGAIEALTEKIPLDNLFRMAKEGLGPSAIKAILKQSGIEASEELVGEYLNTLQNYALLGDKSDYSLYRANLIEQGYSEADATAAANAQFFVVNPLKAAAGGFISGGVMTGFASAMNQHSMTSYGKAVIAADQQERVIAEIYLAAPEGSNARDMVESLKVKLDAGEKVSASEIGRLAAQYQSDMRAEAEKKSPDPDMAKYAQTKSQNPDTTVLDAAATELKKISSMDIETAQEQGKLITDLAKGEDIDVSKIDMTNPAVQKVFVSKTGAEISEAEAKDEKALKKIFLSASEAAKATRILEGKIRTSGDAVQSQIAAEMQRRNAENQVAAGRALQAGIDQAEDPGVLFADGTRLTRDAFYEQQRALAAQQGLDLTDDQLDALYRYEQEYNRTTGPIPGNAAEDIRRSLDNAQAVQEPATEAQKLETKWVAKRAEKVLSDFGISDVSVEYDGFDGNENGYWDPSSGKIVLNGNRLTNKRAILWALGHELTHPSAAGTPALTEDIISAFQKLNELGSLSPRLASQVKDLDKLIATKRATYEKHLIKKAVQALQSQGLTPLQIGARTAKAKQQITAQVAENEAYIREEIAADWMGEVFRDTKLLNKLAGEKHSILERAQEAVQRLWARLSGKESEEYRESRKILDRLGDELETALRDAGKLKVVATKSNQRLSVDTKDDSEYTEIKKEASSYGFDGRSEAGDRGTDSILGGTPGRGDEGRSDGGLVSSALAESGSLGSENSGGSVQLVSPQTRDAMRQRGLPDLGLQRTTNYIAFSAALDNARAANLFGAMVDGHSADDLRNNGTAMFITATELAGVAVDPDGNITSVFKNPTCKTRKAVRDLLITALSNGGTKLDCYVRATDDDLADKYAQLGFEPVAWLRFNREYAPPDWNYELFGEPDVVFWVHNGDSPETVAEKAGSYPYYEAEDIHALPEFTDYMEAWDYRDRRLEERRFSLEDSEGNALSAEQAAFFRESRARDEDGNLQVVYHGTVNDFTVFDRAYGNAEGDFGKGFYFTNNKQDVGTNYATENGPDLTTKIERYAEFLMGQDEMDEDEALQEARARYITSAPKTITSYLNIKNPVILGGEHETQFTFTTPYDDGAEEYGDAEGTLVDFIQALQEELGGDYAGAEAADLSELWDLGYAGEGAGAAELIKTAKEIISFVEDEETGDLANGEVVRAAFENMGFDGIIDNTVAWKFGTRSGRRNIMAGVNEGTTHYIVFSSNQAKQVDNISPTPDPDIRYSLDEDIEAVLKGTDSDTYNAVYLGEMPGLYSHFGIELQPITITKQHLRNINAKESEGGHDIPINVLQKLPELLADPLLLYDSYNPAHKESIVVVTRATTSKNGKQTPVLIPLRLNGSARVDGESITSTPVTSVYAHDDFNLFANWSAYNNSMLGYSDDAKRSPVLSKIRGVIYPYRSEKIGSMNIVAQSKNAVNAKNNPDRRFSLSDSEEYRVFMQQFNEQYGSGSAEDAIKTVQQLQRAKMRAEQRAEELEQKLDLSKWSAKIAQMTAVEQERVKGKDALARQRSVFASKAQTQQRKENMRAALDLEEARQKKLEALSTASAMKTIALYDQRERLNTTHAEKIARLKEDARIRLNRAKRAEDYRAAEAKLAGQMHEGSRIAAQKSKTEEAKRNAAYQREEARKLNRRDAKEAAKILRRNRNAVVPKLENAPVDTLRKLPKEKSRLEKIRGLADTLRTKGRSFYRWFVNAAQEIDNFSALQADTLRAGTLANIVGGTSSTVESIFKRGLVSRNGDSIGEAMQDAVLMWKGAGKHRKVDLEKQALLQDYMLHKHNVTRMSFRANARAAVEAWEAKHPWLSTLDAKEFKLLVADNNPIAEKYVELMQRARDAKDKAIFPDADGKPVTAETSQKIVDTYESEQPWVKEKAEEIYAWWDQFMQEWAVGTSLSQTDYDVMKEIYPYYVPTYRADKNVGGAAFVGRGSASTGQAVKRAIGGMSEVQFIENSYADLVNKIVRLNRNNELFRNIIDTAMLDDAGAFSGFAIYDWESAPDTLPKLIHEMQDVEQETTKTSLEKLDNGAYRVNAWTDGERISAFISEEMYHALMSVTGTKTGSLGERVFDAAVKTGNALTGPMKTMITGINPFFATRNVSRDVPTAIVNSISGLAFPKYYAKAAAEIAKNSANWQRFQALGGAHSGYYNNENGFAVAIAQKQNVVSRAVEKMGAFNNVTEAQTRFAEYLATISRLPGGDTYENRLQGIKNAAEVTVDFSRKGTAGKLINAWIPYWNPSVQGVDKVIRSVLGTEKNAKAIAKHAAITTGRAALTTIVWEAVLYAVLQALGRREDWEGLSDRTKDTYYCIPWFKEHTFIKVPKNREWGAILGTPFSRMLQGLDGREDPFENYLETSFIPNFLPSGPLDAIGISQAVDLETNKDFAGRTIVPYAYQSASPSEQYDGDTTLAAMGAAETLNATVGNLVEMLGGEMEFSPMQIDYIIHDYCGDFISMLFDMAPQGLTDGSVTPEDVSTELLKALSQPMFADNRYSNQLVSEYYDVLDSLDQAISDMTVRGEDYKNSTEYKLRSALNSGIGKEISALNTEVRDMPDGAEKDAAKAEIVTWVQQALDFYEQTMSGQITDPKLYQTYSQYSSTVRDELMAMDSFGDEYGIRPSTYKPTAITYPEGSRREFVLTEEQRSRYAELYAENYDSIMTKVIQSTRYKKADQERKAELLEAAREDVLDSTKKDLVKELKSAGVKTTRKK